MNTLVIVLIAAVVLVCAYAFYGRWVAKTWGVNPNAQTPAVKFNDGKSSPAHWRLCGYVNPVRSNNRMGHMWKPRTSRSWRDGPLGPRSFAAT